MEPLLPLRPAPTGNVDGLWIGIVDWELPFSPLSAPIGREGSNAGARLDNIDVVATAAVCVGDDVVGEDFVEGSDTGDGVALSDPRRWL